MNTPTSNVIQMNRPLELPEPGYPILTHMVSNALFPDMQAKEMNCQHCGASISLLADKSVWSLDESHPLVPEMKVARMFLGAGGVDVYAVSNDGKACTRSFVPMSWIRLTEEVMPLNVFVEELANTVTPGSPMITRMVTNSFSEKLTKVACPSCKVTISVPMQIDKIKDDPVAWTVGQPHPYTLSGKDIKILRILIEEGGIEVYSVSGDGKNGMRHSIPMEWVRFTEEALAPDVFVKELEAAELGGPEDGEPGDPEDEEEEEEEETAQVQPQASSPEPAPVPAPVSTNGQPTSQQPS